MQLFVKLPYIIILSFKSFSGCIIVMRKEITYAGKLIGNFFPVIGGINTYRGLRRYGNSKLEAALFSIAMETGKAVSIYGLMDGNSDFWYPYGGFTVVEDGVTLIGLQDSKKK